MPKSEVYSWRVTPELKQALEEKAQLRGVSLGAMLEEISMEFLSRPAATAADDEAEQQRIWERVKPYIGSIRGGDPDRASQVRERVRERLPRRRAAGRL